MELTDEALVERWRGGDMLAGELLLQRYQVRVFAYLYRLAGDRAQAEDLLQETMTRLIQQLPRFDTGRRFSTWLYTIGTNLWRDHRRSRRRSERREAGGQVEPVARATEPSPLDGMERREVEAEVRQALADLDEDHRVVLTLRHYQGLSYAQIAEVLGCPVGTVKSRMHAGVAALRDRFLKKGLLGENRENELHRMS